MPSRNEKLDEVRLRVFRDFKERVESERQSVWLRMEKIEKALKEGISVGGNHPVTLHTARTILRNARARINGAFFGAKPYFDFTGTNQKTNKAAPLVKRWYNSIVEDSGKIRSLRQCVSGALALGEYYLFDGWRIEERAGNTWFSGPRSRPIHPFDIWKTTTGTIEEDGCIERMRMSWDELESNGRNNKDGGWRLDGVMKARSEYGGTTDREWPMNQQQRFVWQGSMDEQSGQPKSRFVDVYHFWGVMPDEASVEDYDTGAYWGGKQCVMSCIKGGASSGWTIVRYGDNPFPFDRPPISEFYNELNYDGIRGESLIEPVLPWIGIQAEILVQILQATSLANMPPFMKRRGARVDNIGFGPGRIIELDWVDENSFRQLGVNPPPQAAFATMQEARTEIQRTSNLAENTFGMSAGGDTTATEVRNVQGNINTNFGDTLSSISDGLSQSAGHDMQSAIKYVWEPQEVAYRGDAAGLAMLDPDDMDGNWEIKPSLSAIGGASERARNESVQTLQIVGQIPALAQPNILGMLAAGIVRTMDHLPNSEEIAAAIEALTGAEGQPGNMPPQQLDETGQPLPPNVTPIRSDQTAPQNGYANRMNQQRMTGMPA